MAVVVAFGIGLTISLLWLTVRVVFALPVLLFEGRRPSMSLKLSALRSKGHHLQIVISTFVWALASFVAVSMAAAFFI